MLRTGDEILCKPGFLKSALPQSSFPSFCRGENRHVRRSQTVWKIIQKKFDLIQYLLTCKAHTVKRSLSDLPKRQTCVVANENLDHIETKFCLISILQRLTTCVKRFINMKSQVRWFVGLIVVMQDKF